MTTPEKARSVAPGSADSAQPTGPYRTIDGEASDSDGVVTDDNTRHITVSGETVEIATRLFYRLPWVKLRIGSNRPVWAARWRDKWFERFDGHYYCGLRCFYFGERLCRSGDKPTAIAACSRCGAEGFRLTAGLCDGCGKC